MTTPSDDGPVVPRDQVPTHRRTMDIEVFEAGDDIVVVARLRDSRPWAVGSDVVDEVHDIELAVSVRRADAVITAARARMDRFPHAECPAIEPAFKGLVGLSVARGYTRAVQERFGRALGCAHLEVLARAIAPVVVQAMSSSALRQGELRQPMPTDSASSLSWIADSCHVWATGGPASGKLALGWRMGRGEYPVPSLVELRSRAAARPAGQEAPAHDGTGDG